MLITKTMIEFVLGYTMADQSKTDDLQIKLQFFFQTKALRIKQILLFVLDRGYVVGSL